MKFGKKPARPGAFWVALQTYLKAEELPTPPLEIGNLRSFSMPWGMFANDQVGDCVFAGFAHQTMMWSEVTHPDHSYVQFSDTQVMADYSALTGYNHDDPATDVGSDLGQAAAFWSRTGIMDAEGNRHKILGSAEVARNPDAVALATYLFGSCGVGFDLPQSAIDQFTNEQPWDVVPGAPSAGGHYVPVIGRNSAGNFLGVTWGRLQAITPAFIAQYCDEAVAAISPEWLNGTSTPRGVNLDQLHADLLAIEYV